MNETRLDGKRILLTQADVMMGPALQAALAEQGATVVSDTRSLVVPEVAADVVRAAGRVDVLIAHLAIPAPTTLATEVGEDEWRDAFAAMVDPLPRLARAVLPQMIERRAGKILVIGS